MLLLWVSDKALADGHTSYECASPMACAATTLTHGC